MESREPFLLGRVREQRQRVRPLGQLHPHAAGCGAGAPSWRPPCRAGGGARAHNFLSSHFNPNVPLIVLVKLPWLSLEIFMAMENK